MPDEINKGQMGASEMGPGPIRDLFQKKKEKKSQQKIAEGVKGIKKPAE